VPGRQRRARAAAGSARRACGGALACLGMSRLRARRAYCPSRARTAQVTPLLVGSAQTEYARRLRARFRAAAPGVVTEERFLGPADLARIYARTRLNCHLCSYDAYGMTVVEAASQGAQPCAPWLPAGADAAAVACRRGSAKPHRECVSRNTKEDRHRGSGERGVSRGLRAGAPSVFNAGGQVGAGDLLSAARGEALEADMSQPAHALADRLVALLSDSAALAAVGAAAAVRARAWTEAANAAALAALVDEHTQ